MSVMRPLLGLRGALPAAAECPACQGSPTPQRFRRLALDIQAPCTLPGHCPSRSV